MKRFVYVQYLVVAMITLFTFSAVFAQEEPTPSGDNGTIEIDVEDAAQSAVDAAESAAESTASSLDAFLARLVEVPQNDIAQILLVIGGVILLLAGWRIYEFIILLAGLLIGASVGAALVADSGTVIEIAGLLIGALVGVALAAFLYYLAVFLIGAYVGIALTGAGASVLGFESVSALVLFIGAIIGGLILLGLSVELLIVLSALVGAQMLTLGLGLGAEWTLIFAIGGILIQFLAARQFGYDIRRAPRRNLFRRGRV